MASHVLPVSADILSTGISTAAGDDPFSLLCALGGNLSAARDWDGPPLAVAPGANPCYAPLTQFPPEATGAFRIEAMVLGALARTLKDEPAFPSAKRLFFLCLPQKVQLQRVAFDTQRLKKKILTAHPGLRNTTFRFDTSFRGGLSLLKKLLLDLNQGRWDEIIFGGADSLANKEVLLAQLTDQDTAEEARVPLGEGAGLLRLQPSGRHERPLARLTLPARSDGSPGHPSSVLTDTLEAADLDWTNIGCLLPVQNKPQPFRSLTSRPEFPRPEQDPPPEELSLCRTLGDTGRAALSLALCAATVRFDFEHPPVENVLVCEADAKDRWVSACLERPVVVKINGRDFELATLKRRTSGRRIDGCHRR